MYIKRRLFLIIFLKYSAAVFCSQLVSLPRKKWFGTTFREFVAQKRIPSSVLFRGMVRNGNSESLFYFGSTERNSELCSLPQKGSEQNYRRLLLFLFQGTEFRVVFSSAEGFGTEFRDFLFSGTTGIPSEITICSVFSVFRGIIFLSEILHLTSEPTPLTSHNPLKVSLKCMRIESPLRNYGNPWTN
jgi:hypothetical protein